MPTLAELEAAHKQLEQQIRDARAALFASEAEALFARFPTLQEFSWPQYTPYFNDGDECVFSVEHYSLSVNGYLVDDDGPLRETLTVEDGVEPGVDWDGRNCQRTKYRKELNPDYDPVLADAAAQISQLLLTFPNQYFKQAFGDHCEVFVRRVEGGGVTTDTDDYSHD